MWSVFSLNSDPSKFKTLKDLRRYDSSEQQQVLGANPPVHSYCSWPYAFNLSNVRTTKLHSPLDSCARIHLLGYGDSGIIGTMISSMYQHLALGRNVFIRMLNLVKWLASTDEVDITSPIPFPSRWHYDFKGLYYYLSKEAQSCTKFNYKQPLNLLVQWRGKIFNRLY
jgi:hypothetical protein